MLTRLFFGIAKPILAAYYGVRWKIRYATKIFGIEKLEEKANEAWIYDRDRFLTYATTRLKHSWPFSTDTDGVNREHMKAILTKNYHAIEKAMALPSPRPSFGQQSGIIDKCIDDCESYIRLFGSDSLTKTTYDVLREYRDRFGKGYDRVERFLREHSDLHDDTCTGGTAPFTPSDIPSGIDGRFFATRHSIRQFGKNPVADETIRSAVHHALLGTPSVCNRQPAKAYVFTDPTEKSQLLALQNGNKGFGHDASHLIIVTSDLQSFVDIGERNQCWVSGGMFAMSLVYALHAQRIATCCLNWDVLPENDKALHSLANIPPSEVIVMMIAVGSYPEHLTVARSERKNVNDVVRFKNA